MLVAGLSSGVWSIASKACVTSGGLEHLNTRNFGERNNQVKQEKLLISFNRRCMLQKCCLYRDN